ncbi:hypothetical protein BST27_09190 [Mycobacterium intermedium]|uniref:Uncharacterized protein n=1 Tax=Mycobacterium intermedium TaxID=28445 RepID=A0A1E3SMI9_MYCIE|nr:hypothetical protein [Mycobacterium intermedium]MCV6967055.1 hypothetical protein [Mycobacterium intermedium]ODR03360.1 hypothetical protein BHQ20_00510 [Mycobacterium intermedium]OPE52941.1 hypothetical protein BV508_00205 [Mycobacterium intermedium]ORB07724.1 hypothetical protein BST27_09190 [Mycobacterium intermedium]
MTTHEHQTLTDQHTDELSQVSEPTRPIPPEVDQKQNQLPSDEAAEVLVETPGPQRETSTEETLFAEDDLAELRGRWAAVQAAFVDDPRECVKKADALVSDLVGQLTNSFAQARSRLEGQWARGEEASTEDLRLALMHYREFFQRLLAV